MNKFALILECLDGSFDLLKYTINEHPFAQRWFELFKRHTTQEYLRDVQYAGFDFTQSEIDGYFDRIDELIKLLDFVVKLDRSNPQESVNRLHTHFPHDHHLEEDPKRIKLLSEYNDLLHLLESTYTEKRVGNGFSLANMQFKFDWQQTLDIEPDEYQYFGISNHFGSVNCHYPHVGRHLMEIFYAKDTNVPDTDIRPQTMISPDCLFHFGSNTYTKDSSKAELMEAVHSFYNRFGLDRLPYALDNPRAALGFVEVAQLDHYYGAGFDDTQRLRQKIKTAKIKNIMFIDAHNKIENIEMN